MSRGQNGEERKRLEERIEEKRKKLNCAIEEKKEYEIVYELSLDVDKAIADYIQMTKEKNK